MKSISQDVLTVKGLDFDTHESLYQAESLAFLLNGDITGFENSGNSSFVQNAMSNELCFKYPDGYSFLGSTRMNGAQLLLFFRVEKPDGTFTSEIGIFDADSCAYVIKLRNPCLDFEGPIQATFKTLSGCDRRRVYWVEDGKPIRFIDVDECLPTKDISDCFDCDTELVFDCEAFNLNKCVKFPKLNFREGLGNLPNGNYQIALALTDDEQRFTEYYVYPEVLKFHTNNQGNNRFGIEISFESCPIGFDQYELVLISHRTDRGTLAQRVGYFDVEQTTNVISEIDDTSYSPIDLTVLSEIFPHYQSAKGIAQNNEQLLLTGLTTREVPNYQPIANQIESQWTEIRVNAKDAHKYKSYMRGEVYAHLIRGVYCDGERTPAFHIWSDAEKKIREREGGEEIFDALFEEVTNNDVCNEGEDPCVETLVPAWQIYDSAVATTPSDPNAEEYCVEFFSGLYQQVEDICQHRIPGIPFTRYDNFFRITVKNKYCQPVPASQNIVVDVLFRLIDCEGTISDYTNTFTLSAGESVYQFVYPARQLVGCFQDECVEETVELLSFTFTDNHLSICEEGDCLEPLVNCDGTITNQGDFGYWESGLQYPNNPCVWGQREDPLAPYYSPYGLSCQKVRYHRFPDNCLTHIHGNSQCGENEYVNILGINFTNIKPFLDKRGQPIKDIVGYEILVVDRANHKSIIHKGLMYNMFEEKLSDCSISYYANYPFNDLNPDPFLSKTRARHSLNPLLDVIVDATPFLEFGFTPVNTYSKSRFEYISPDVSYERNDAGQYVQLYTEENGPVSGRYSYTEEMPEVLVLSDLDYILCAVIITASALLLDIDGAYNMGQAALDGFMNSLKPKQYATNYYAETQYRGFNCERIVRGNQRRKINISQYTLPTKMLIGENKVNNFQRESGLFLELCSDFLDPFVTERSRIRYSDNFCKPNFAFCEETNFSETPVTSSYYAGIKIERPNQYGLPGSALSRVASSVIDWNNSGASTSGVVLGGDIFITKHKHIRKFPFFTNLPLNTPPKTEYETEAYKNVWHSRYWFDPGNAASVALLFPMGSISSLAYAFNNERNLEKTGPLVKVNCDNDSNSCSKDDILRVEGTFYTHVIGEIEYWCESEYIGGFRELNEIPESDVERATEDKIKYRTIQYPELFLYNRQYHWKGFSSFVQTADIDFDCCRPEVICGINSMAYSLPHDPFRKSDAWTKFLPANSQQFSSRDGNLLGIREIDDFNLLVFFEDALYTTQRDEELLTQNGKVFLGTPAIFERRMRKISNDATGFGGCIDLDSFVSCRWGNFYFDRRRKKFCTIDGVAVDATGKIQSWLNENLEGPVSGIYDNFTDNIYYTGIGKGGCQWTISYKPSIKQWVSFHSFTPDAWLQMPNNFLSGNSTGLWRHNKKYSYQNYYGVTYPFEVGAVIKNKDMTMPQHFEVWSEWMKYDDYGKKRYDPKAFFDQILVYNNLRTTGYKDFVVKDINNDNHYGAQNRSSLVEVTPLEDFTYRVNKFATESTYQPTTELGCMEIISSKVGNVSDPTSEPMRGKWAKVHLRANKGEHKILLQTELGFNDDIQQ